MTEEIVQNESDYLTPAEELVDWSEVMEAAE